MRICARCVLPETFPGIRFDEEGVCHVCRRSAGRERTAEVKARFRAKFDELVGMARGRGAYEAVMAYSGGKDSTYTLAFLARDLGLRVLAWTFDQGYISPRARENIRAVSSSLGVDHLYFAPAPEAVKRAFRAAVTDNPYPPIALERASGICNTCMNLAKSVLLKTALEKGIPLIAFGWSPGQAPVQSSVMRYNQGFVRQSQSLMRGWFSRLAGDGLDRYLLDDEDYRRMTALREQFGADLPANVHPLAFLDYDEGRIVEEIRSLGWEPPSDTDSNSSNCLLNSFANQAHLAALRFHPYAFEIAELVRQGCMTREEGLLKLKNPGDPALSARIRAELGLDA